MAISARRRLGALVCSLALTTTAFLAPAVAGAQTTVPSTAAPTTAPATAAPSPAGSPSAIPVFQVPPGLESAVPATAAPVPGANAGPCAPADLGLREIAVKPDRGEPTEATYVLQNRGNAPCRIAGALGVRLLDRQGKSVPLRFAVRNAMAMLLTLAPGGEASFTVSYVAPVPAGCPAANRVAVFIPPQTTAIMAPATIAACSGGMVRVTNLRPGAPRAVSAG